MAEKITKSQVNQGVAASNQTDDFENPNVGESFGGSYSRLELNENEVSGLLEYVKDSKVQVENDNGPEIITSPVAKTEEGKLVSLPISAIFRKHWKEANVEKGDKFKIKRYVDVVKKRGKGSGNKLKVYAVKVYSRAEKAA